MHLTLGPIRGRLFRDLVLLVLITVGALVAASALLINDLKQDVAKARIGAATALMSDEVRSLLTPVQQQLLITRDALRGNNLTPADTRALNAQLMPPLAHIGQIAGAIFADDQGTEYYLRHDDTRWLTRTRRAETGAAPQFKRTFWAADGKPLESTRVSMDYEPRERPWFSLAAARLKALPATDQDGALTWSPPYRFHDLEVPGITLSIAWRDGGTLLVSGFDVTLERIIATIDQLAPGTGGRGFLFSSDGGVYNGQADDAQGAGFYSAEQQQGGTLAFEAIAAWRAADEPVDTLVNFESGGQRWWGGFLPFHNQDSTAWVGVAMPTSQTLGVLQKRWHRFVVAGIAILALGIGLALRLVRNYSRQLRDLPKLAISRAEPETDLYDLIGRGEGTHLEFKSTMRTNLHTGKPGKEIELSWLKGVAAFLNTEGGILLMGVADNGEVLGLEADAFANDDKCRLHFKNLINQHLGPEYARFLRFELFQLGERQIAAVECEQADAPTFLRHKQGESFLIRNGPSNIELPISRALGYIRGRFKGPI